MTTTRALQQEIVAHKRRKGFNISCHDREVLLAMRELGELHEALDHNRRDEIGGELADVAIYLLTIAEMHGLDLGEEVVRKMEVNRSRRYEPDESGTLVRVEEPVQS
ncbi:MazG nucleotide pyrophosphohydrolase domain-containing protein [Actinomadura viridis]|uniref:MazG nucleotide pyrophosphohydrolase domain-containing protein n=1 Tax=Actinomadura viridis TaxID=58110 RepID=UPI0036BA606F